MTKYLKIETPFERATDGSKKLIEGKFKNETVEYLANCSTMKKIVRMAAKMLSDQDHKTATKQEKEQAAKEHAIYIIGCVEYLANNK